MVDTGGILPDDKEFIPAEIFRQARFALDEAAAIVMVVDGRAAITGPDMELARLLQRTGKPLFLAVNKVDSPKQEHVVDDFRRLGIRNVLPVSAEHGDGVAELLEEVLKVIPTVASEAPSLKPRRSREAGLCRLRPGGRSRFPGFAGGGGRGRDRGRRGISR